ncbi:unnamed protein product [Notodromas monacha]|uniref:Nucleoside diphosphate kinase n=1 Tax=Notodromas monacha TaxID=399045 RepID=A0A7R9GF01_9CRUS|nr:unnamed protein product [Notodromas monacha]CAG0920291.1 unnamed protein product [Notodromas monacha]
MKQLFFIFTRNSPKKPATRNKMTFEGTPRERTFICVKPDSVQRGLIGDIIKRFEQKGFKLVAMKMMQASEELLKAHYEEHAAKPFFPPLVKYMGSGPLVPMVWEGQGVVKMGRMILGETNPLDDQPGTIRGDYSIRMAKNVAHGSDAVESAKREISLWFTDSELNSWSRCDDKWIYE